MTLIGLFLKANQIENGDTNAVGMYVVVFLIPIIIVTGANAYILNSSEKLKSTILKRFISLIPILLLLLISQVKGIGVYLFDADISFLGKIGFVTIGITNLVWNVAISNIQTFKKMNTITNKGACVIQK